MIMRSLAVVLVPSLCTITRYQVIAANESVDMIEQDTDPWKCACITSEDAMEGRRMEMILSKLTMKTQRMIQMEMVKRASARRLKRTWM